MRLIQTIGGILVAITLCACQINDTRPTPAADDGPVLTCFGGSLDGSQCGNPDEVMRCEGEGGICGLAGLTSPDYEQLTSGCECSCNNVFTLPFNTCVSDLKTSCSLSSNCNREECDGDSCVWEGATWVSHCESRRSVVPDCVYATTNQVFSNGLPALA